MAERTIKTKMQLIGGDEYVAGIEKITAALRKASEAKKEFDDLFAEAPDFSERNRLRLALCRRMEERR